MSTTEQRRAPEHFETVMNAGGGLEVVARAEVSYVVRETWGTRLQTVAVSARSVPLSPGTFTHEALSDAWRQASEFARKRAWDIGNQAHHPNGYTEVTVR